MTRPQDLPHSTIDRLLGQLDAAGLAGEKLTALIDGGHVGPLAQRAQEILGTPPWSMMCLPWVPSDCGGHHMVVAGMTMDCCLPGFRMKIQLREEVTVEWGGGPRVNVTWRDHGHWMSNSSYLSRDSHESGPDVEARLCDCSRYAKGHFSVRWR